MILPPPDPSDLRFVDPDEPFDEPADLTAWRTLHEAMETGQRRDLTSYWCPHLPHRWYPESTEVGGREVIVLKATFEPVDPDERCLACRSGMGLGMGLGIVGPDPV